MPNLRILIAYEAPYFSYAEAFEATVRNAAPRAEVRLCKPSGLRAEVSRFDPHLVVSSEARTAAPGAGAAWFKLPTETDEPAEFSLGGQRWSSVNPGLGSLVGVVEGVDELVRGGRDPAKI